MSATAHPGLTTAEVEARRRALGDPAPPPTSLPVRAILRRNVFTLINAITLGFLVLIVVAGAWEDALFALIIVINSLIGIVQELRAKRTLDRHALLVAPHATVRRDGATRSVLADEVVPEPPGGAHRDPAPVMADVSARIITALDELGEKGADELRVRRYERLRAVGVFSDTAG